MAVAAKSQKNLRKVKIKKEPISRAAVKSINDKYYGAEPIDISKMSYTDVLNWYNYMHEQEQAREWLIEYVKRKNYPKAEIAFITKAPKYRVPTTVGWIARILMNGNTIEDKSMDFFLDHIAALIEMGKKVKEEAVKEEVKVADRPVVSIQDRIRAKAAALFADCEAEVIDEYGSIYDFLVAREVSPMAASYFKEKYQPIYDEIMSDDPDIKEAYGKRLKDQRSYWQSVMDELDRYIGNKKAVKVRKPREKKTKSAVDQVKSLNYQKEFPALKIVSVNPAEIIGANQLWAYNTKTRKLTCFNALGPSGLQVKGASVIGFDVEKSSTKRLRKPDTVIQQLLSAGKVSLRKFMSEISSVGSEAKGRINNDTVLLRVVK